MKSIILKCTNCDTTFERKQSHYSINTRRKDNIFCSTDCMQEQRESHAKEISSKFQVDVTCLQCNSLFKKQLSQIKLHPNNFCSRSCAATYNNTHKTTGTRRSKLECQLEEQLIQIYPTLTFEFNQKKAINSELDIYIPSLSLAFELNGVFHYEPIYGKEKLNQIQTNDDRKFAACIENGIELCIIDVSSLTYFKIATANKFLTLITDIINAKVKRGVGYDPTTCRSASDCSTN